VNRDERKCLSSVHPSGVMTGVDSQSNLTGGGMSIAKRKSILVSFYKSVVGTLFPPHELAASLTGTPVAYTLLESDQGFKSKLEVFKCHTRLTSMQFNLLYANIIRNVHCLN